jgi:hypothetical protein
MERFGRCLKMGVGYQPFATFWNMPLTELPIEMNRLTAATEMKAATSAYSIAVPPALSSDGRLEMCIDDAFARRVRGDKWRGVY